MIQGRRALVCLAIVAACAPAGACRRAQSDARERAYRANNRGVAELEQFRYPEAAAAFRQALEIDPSLAVAHLNLGIALFYAQDAAGAARETGEAARLLPSAPQPAYLLGLIARTDNRTADALREFQRVRQIDPSDVGASVNLGQIYLEQRRYPEAIAALRASATAEPYNVTAAYNLGLALTRAGQTDEGRQALARAQELRGTGYAVTYGTGYLEQGRYAEAIASTGAEPDLVDAATPGVTFTPSALPGAVASAPPLASPFGRRFGAESLTASGTQQIADALAGCVVPFDADGDGDLDLFDAASGAGRLMRNDGAGNWSEFASSVGAPPAGAVAVGCVAGDVDNDGRSDLFVLRYGQSSLYRNEGDGRFADVTAGSRIPRWPFLPGAAALADVDHDGDLDLIVGGLADVAATRAPGPGGTIQFPDEFAPAPLRLLRNDGKGVFADATVAAHLDVSGHIVAIVPTDYDNRRDVDVLIVSRGAPPMLFQNLRDGTFRDVAEATGLSGAARAIGGVRAVAAADVNKDEFPDFLIGGDAGAAFAMSDGKGRFTAVPAPADARATLGAQLADYDGDGLFDLLTWSDAGPRLFRNVGTRWADVSATALRGASSGPAPSSPRSLAFADWNGDGRTDFVSARRGAIALWRNDGAAGHGSLRVVLKGRVSNRSGFGSKIQLRAGSLSARIETSAATPAVAPADIVFGLGRRAGADAVRVLWPSGILQAEAREPSLPSPLAVEELDRKPSSCPFLFTWNGNRFEFVTDFMGGGEMGYWEGPGRRNVPDPIEYVRIDGRQLQARDGRYELRVTNELEEALFADRLQLVAVSHPEDVAVYPNEGMTTIAKPFRLFAVRGERVPRAVDERGRDLTERLTTIDRRYADGFALERFRGYAAPHTLTLDLAPVPDAPVLLLTGWTDYAFSSDNVAADQAGLTLTPPALQARDQSGRWRTIVDDIGIPVGRPQTVTVDLADRLRPGEHEVRIVTNMRIYWDRVAVGAVTRSNAVRVASMGAAGATLRARGFSAELRPDGQDPPRYDYDRVTTESPWKTLPGRYTREGDVAPLLTTADDMFVVAKPGDEIALSFDAATAGPLPAGWTRTFLLLADGFSKEMDINSVSPDTLEPLPFHRMTTYPFRGSEAYPDDAAHRQYVEKYNTRLAPRSVPMLRAPVR